MICADVRASARALTAAEPAASAAIGHRSPLPAALIERVPPSEKLVLNFVLSYLETEALPAQLLVNGGYVRDLLLGKTPDDLDLSLCLRKCPPHVTIDSLLQELGAFARRRPDLNVSAVNVTTILSDTSKDKNVDTAKAHLLVGAPPERIEVDFMPTIGEETYDERDRIPLRDVRGTPEQDALRRDLTIGAMLLEISRAEDHMDVSGADTPTAAAAAADALQWKLLDFYGGLDDLRAGVLRSPYPAGRPLPDVWAEVMRSAEDQQLALALGLSPESPAGAAATAGAGAPARAAGAEAFGSSDVETATLQIVWWVKVLKDDPLRLLRALRFAAKLRFELHPTFWLAVPFALSPLQSKVAGSRKATELLKIAKAGNAPLLDFLSLSFGRPVSTPPSGEGTALPSGTLASSLFGGADPKGEARFLAAPNGFDSSLMRAAAETLPSGLGEDETLGAGLAAAAIACNGEWGSGDAMEEAPTAESTADADATAAAAADAAMTQLSAACDGLCASRDLRAAAETPLYCASLLLQGGPTSGMSSLFAQAASPGASAETTEEFAGMVHMWETLKLEKWLQGKAGAGYHPHFSVALASTRCSTATGSELRARLERLIVPGVNINGKALVGLPKIPPPLRGVVIAQLHVLARLRGDAELELSEPEQLRAYLDETCEGLLTKLYGEWYDEGGALRPAYLPSRTAKKQKGGNK